MTVAPPKQKLSSSFVVLGAEPPGPVEQAAAAASPKPRSTLDTPPDYAWEPAPLRISASVIAFGAPAVEQTKVASIGTPKPQAEPAPEPAAKPASRARALLPKVIRAGVKGHAFPDYVAPQPAVAQNPDPAPEPAPPPDEPPPGRPGPTPAASPGPASARDPERPSLR